MRDIKARQGNREGMRKAKRAKRKETQSTRTGKGTRGERVKEELRTKRQGEDRREQRGRGSASGEVRF